MAQGPEKAPPPKRLAPAPKTEEGAPTWMVTFADMMTLLLCFFVLLLSFANQDVIRFKEVMGSLREAFGVQVDRPADQFVSYAPSVKERKDIELSEDNKQLLGLIMLIRKQIEVDPDLEQKISVLPQKEGVVMRISSGVFFDPGESLLKPEAKAVLQTVINLLNEQKYNVSVRGHTDDTLVDGSRYRSNWELASARAAAATDWILDNSDLRSTRLKAVGFADSRPLVPNDNDRNRALNRRLEFYFHRPEDDSL
jgi:chemotaxis protein MotB